MVGNRLQLSIFPTNDSELVVNRGLLIGMILDVLLDLLAREPFRIKSAPQWHGLGADERLVFVDQIEAGSIQLQVGTQFDIAWTRARLQRLVQSQPVRIALAPINALQISACFYQLLD